MKLEANPPFILDMIEWSYIDFPQNDLPSTPRIELYTSVMLGCCFSLRIGELGELRMSDIRLRRDEDNDDFAPITIRNKNRPI